MKVDVECAKCSHSFQHDLTKGLKSTCPVCQESGIILPEPISNMLTEMGSRADIMVIDGTGISKLMVSDDHDCGNPNCPVHGKLPKDLGKHPGNTHERRSRFRDN